MGNVLAKFQIRPTDIDIDIEKLAEKCKKLLEKYGRVAQLEINPVAFGLKEIIIILILPGQGPVEEMEEKLNQLEEVERAEAVDVRLAFG